jgi:hypothetical protein
VTCGWPKYRRPSKETFVPVSSFLDAITMSRQRAAAIPVRNLAVFLLQLFAAFKQLF